MIFHTSELSAIQKQYYLQHLVAPRPICFASTIDNRGRTNLSPFSFFNLFSNEPPIVIFSPVRRLRNNTTKHTLDNLFEIPEVVINIVTYNMVQQVSLASCDFPKNDSEFTKAGFTPEPATLVRPMMVKEAPAKLECVVQEIKSLGENAGAGQLVIAKVVCFHINDSLLDDQKQVDQQKLDLVARLGGDWYARINPEHLFRVPKPNSHNGIGFDALPIHIKNSRVLTGNHLALLANVSSLPQKDATFSDSRLGALFYYFRQEQNLTNRIHAYAKELLYDGQIEQAWQVLLSEYNAKEQTKRQ